MKLAEKITEWKILLQRTLKDPKRSSSLLLAVGGAGILLLFLSSLWGREERPVSEAAGTEPDRTAFLQQELEAFVSRIDGAGECVVLLTFADEGEQFYLKEQSTESGGSKEEYVLADGKDGKSAIETSFRSPQVQGVAVLCSGGDDQTVRLAVTEAVSTLLGISSHRVFVSKISS